MIKAVKSVAKGALALCAGALLMSGSANAQYYDYGPGPGGSVYGGPPPAGPMGGPPGRGVRLSQYEVHDLVRGLGYRRVSEPILSGRHYMVTALDEGAPVAIRVDAYSGRVVDVQPLIYGRAAPGGYYPPEAMPPGGSARTARPPVPNSAPLPPSRPFAREGEPEMVPEASAQSVPEVGAGESGAPVAGPAEQQYPSAQGQWNEALPAQDDPGPAPQLVTPAEQGVPPNVVQQPAPESPNPAPQAVAPASPASPVGANAVAPAPSVVAKPVAAPPPVARPVPDVGAGVSTPGGATAGTASVLSRPQASR